MYYNKCIIKVSNKVKDIDIKTEHSTILMTLSI